MRAKTVNQSLTPGEKREEVMRILKKSGQIQTVPHDSYMKFHDLSLTDLTPEEIVDELLNESVNFERGTDPKKKMGIGFTNYADYITRELGEDEADRFWEVQYNLANDQKPGDIMEEYLDLLYKVPLEDQLEWAKDRLVWWKEAKEEGWV